LDTLAFIRTARCLAVGILLMCATTLSADEPPTTLARIRQFNPWLSAEDPLELPLKLHSLLKDQYTFFRGTVDLYYDWCREHCADWIKFRDDGLLLHGDVHLGNIGTYRAGALNRFAVVDLDETFQGPFQLDVLRGLISLRFAALDNRIDLSQSDRTTLLDQYLAGYFDGLTGRLSGDDLASRHPLVKSLLKKAAVGDPAELADKFCEGKPPRGFRPVRLKKHRVADIMTPVDNKTRQAVAEAVRVFMASDGAGFIAAKRKSHPVEAKDVLDVVRWSRIDSGGSQGLRKYLVLLAPDEAWDNAPLILQLKEEPAPAAARAGLVNGPAGVERAAQVSTNYSLLIDPPLWLVGHTEVDGRGYLIRTKDPFSEEPEAGDFDTPAALMDGARMLGATLGQAHRAGMRVHPVRDERIAAIAAKVKTLAPQFAERSEAALTHLHRAFVNLQQDAEARTMVEVAKRRIKTAQKAGS